MSTIRVGSDTTPFSYNVTVARGAINSWTSLAPIEGARSALVITQRPVAVHYLDRVKAVGSAAGLRMAVHEIPDGEDVKNVTTMQSIWDACAAHELHRSDLIVGLGGGVVTDIAGFAAASYNRGIRVVHIPTTILGQVDAAIGGKTGINIAAGKNLVGAFHHPAAVIADPQTLKTLTSRVRSEGFGEIVKAAMLVGGPFWKTVLDGPDDATLDDLVLGSISVKADIVTQDALELGVRAHLNLGHTYGHALENATGYGTYLHGEAVGLGLLVAAQVSRTRGLLQDLSHDALVDLLGAFGLPTSVLPIDRDTLWRLMRRDKKATGQVRFVLLRTVGDPFVDDVTRDEVDAAIDLIEAR